MALTLNANWVAAMSKPGAKIRHLVAITDGTDTWKATDGLCEQFDYPASIQRIDAISAEMDTLTRKTTIGNLFVAVDDSWVRNIIASRVAVKRIRGQKITIEIGTNELAESDFEPLFVGVIEGINPSPHRGPVVLDCLDLFSVLRREKITGYWNGYHPFEIIEDIISTIAGLPAGLVDATSLDPSQAEHDDVSHFMVARYSPSATYMEERGNEYGRAVESPTDAWELVQSLCTLTDSQMVVTEDGQITNKRYAPSASAVFAWGVDDIISLEQEDTDANLTNRFTFKWMKSVEKGALNITVPTHSGGTETIEMVAAQSFAQRYEVGDSTSQSDYALPGMASRIINRDLSTEWLDWGWSYLAEDLTDSATTMVLRFDQANIGSFSGCHNFVDRIPKDGFEIGYTASFDAQSAWMQPSSDRPVYLRIGEGEDVEVVKVTSAITKSSNVELSPLSYPGGDDEGYNGEAAAYITPAEITLTIARAQLGTTAKAHEGSPPQYTTAGPPNNQFGNTRVVDITIPVWVANRKIQRYSNAAPRVTVRVPLREYAPQLGDLGTITWPDFLSYDLDGVSAADGKWEVVRKSVNAYSDPPNIEYDLVLGVEAAGTLAHRIPVLMPSVADIGQSDARAELVRSFVANGKAATDGGGLVLNIAKGITSNGKRMTRDPAFTANLTASVDNYLIESAAGKKRLASVAIGAAPPDLAQDEVFVAKATTDGTGITSIDQTIRRDAPLQGAMIETTTIGLSQQITTGENFGGATIMPNGDFGVRSLGSGVPPDNWEVG